MESQLPKTWKEKLLALEVGGEGEHVDIKSSAYSGIRELRESDNLEISQREFTVRMNPAMKDQLYVWRLK